MKKIICLLLAIMLVFSFTACGDNGGNEPAAPDIDNNEEATETDNGESNDNNESDVDLFKAGDEITTENFIFTVNEIGISDTICIEEGDSIGIFSNSGDSVQAKEGYQWLYYSISYKFTGKSELLAHNQFYGSVKYGDSNFWAPSIRFFNCDGNWSGLDYSSFDAIGVPLPAIADLYKYDPWVDKDYELHGAVQVPVKAIEDTETPLILRLDFLSNEDLEERNNCVTEF